MLYSEIKKTLENLCDLLMEQSNEISTIKEKVMFLTSSSPKKKGLEGLAEIMCCSTTTAKKWLKTGIIPHTKIGSIYLFNEIEVLEALKKRKSKRPDKDIN
jgi:hypothetical protein